MKLLCTTALALTALPATALACGGFFCSSSPVDQQAERIIFRQTSPETVESYVEIQYQGDPQAFAWIVPVPGVPRDLDTFPATAFQLLDLATGPTFQLPDECQFFGAPAAAEGDSADGGQVPGPRDGNGVDVLDHQIVDGYETVTVKATDGRLLVEWLRQNGYRIVDEMAPFIDLYIGQGLNFLAAKLLPGEDSGAIKPLKMVYDSPNPMVPLRLTSIAAVPEMGVKVFLLGAGRFSTQNVPELEVDPAEIVFDLNRNQSNWPAAVARTIDASQGEGMVADFAGPAQTVRDSLQGVFSPPLGEEDPEAARADLFTLLEGTEYVTRLYGRFSAEEMGRDITFEAAADLGDVDRNRVLTVEQVPACGQESPPPDPCSFVACGQGGLCVMSPDANGVMVPGCACVDGAAARAVTDTTVQSGVATACVDTRMNVDPIRPPSELPQTGEPVGMPVPSLPDPCVGNPCGEFGTCFSLNAQQTCQCERGYVAVAVADDEGKLTAVCRSPADAVPDDFYRRTLPEPTLPFPGKSIASGTLSDEGCSVSGPAGRTVFPAWLLAALPLLGLRRRRGR